MPNLISSPLWAIDVEEVNRNRRRLNGPECPVCGRIQWYRCGVVVTGFRAHGERTFELDKRRSATRDSLWTCHCGFRVKERSLRADLLGAV